VLYALTFIKPRLAEVSPQRLVFRPDWEIILFVTTICTILGIFIIALPSPLLCSIPLGIALLVYVPLGVPLLAYVLYHFMAGLFFKIVIDLPTQRIKQSFLKSNQEISFSEVKEVILEGCFFHYYSFTILLHLHTNQTFLLAFYRNTSNGEVKAYNTAALVAHFLKVNFYDKTLPALVEKKLKSSLHFINEHCVLIKAPFGNIPFDFLIFSFVFFCFGLFIMLVLPPYAPWLAKIFFPLAAFGMALGIFILGYKAWLCPQLIEKDDKYLTIKRILGGRICLFKKNYQKRKLIGLFLDDMYIAKTNMEGMKRAIVFTLLPTASVTGSERI
jgi:hypothetical protein